MADVAASTRAGRVESSLTEGEAVPYPGGRRSRRRAPLPLQSAGAKAAHFMKCVMVKL